MHRWFVRWTIESDTILTIEGKLWYRQELTRTSLNTCIKEVNPLWTFVSKSPSALVACAKSIKHSLALRTFGDTSVVMSYASGWSGSVHPLGVLYCLPWLIAPSKNIRTEELLKWINRCSENLRLKPNDGCFTKSVNWIAEHQLVVGWWPLVNKNRSLVGRGVLLFGLSGHILANPMSSRDSKDWNVGLEKNFGNSQILPPLMRQSKWLFPIPGWSAAYRGKWGVTDQAIHLLVPPIKPSSVEVWARKLQTNPSNMWIVVILSPRTSVLLADRFIFVIVRCHCLKGIQQKYGKEHLEDLEGEHRLLAQASSPLMVQYYSTTMLSSWVGRTPSCAAGGLESRPDMSVIISANDGWKATLASR